MTQAETILTNVRYATLSTVDENGRAWAAPVWYAFAQTGDLVLYWWSSVNSQHSQNIARSSDVYITIFDSTVPEGEGSGLYMRARAEQVPDDELDQAIEYYNATTRQFKLSRKNTTGTAPTRLYQARPITLQVNDGIENEGFYQDIRRDTII